MRSNETPRIHIDLAFMGLSLLANGFLVSGVYGFVRPPQVPVVLFRLHAGIRGVLFSRSWGAVHCIHYTSGKGRS